MGLNILRLWSCEQENKFLELTIFCNSFAQMFANSYEISNIFFDYLIPDLKENSNDKQGVEKIIKD